LKKKLEEDPDSLIFVPLAEAYRKAGSLDDACRVCRKGLEKNPDYSNAHLVLGRIYQGQVKLEDAILEFEKVLEIDPENLMAHSLLGSLFMQKFDYKAAIDEYQAILTLNPDDDETQKLLKVAIEKAANAPQTVSDNQLKETGADKKSDSGNMASVTMAELYLKQGHVDKAIETYEELLKKDPNNAVVRQRLVELKEKIAIDSFSSVQKKNELNSNPNLKAEKAKQAHLNKEKDSKFSDDDILQVMAMDRNEKSIKPLDKPDSTETKKTDVKVEIKETEKVKDSSVSKSTSPPHQFSPARIDALKAVLAELTSITGIRRCFLTSLEGISVVSVGENSNNDSLEKQILSIFKETSQSANKLSQGSLQQVLVTAETGHILLVSFAGGILVVLADHQINLGMLRLAMDGAAKKVEKVN
jgi:tetratricopeptide (TPR) repeat protein